MSDELRRLAVALERMVILQEGGPEMARRLREHEAGNPGFGDAVKPAQLVRIKAKMVAEIVAGENPQARGIIARDGRAAIIFVYVDTARLYILSPPNPDGERGIEESMRIRREQVEAVRRLLEVVPNV